MSGTRGSAAVESSGLEPTIVAITGLPTARFAKSGERPYSEEQRDQEMLEMYGVRGRKTDGGL
jgi:hypothetical protein